MHGDVLRLQVNDLFQGVGKGGRVVRRQTGDQIHIDCPKADVPRLTVGPQGIAGAVPPADGRQGLGIHGLGIDADAVAAERPQHLQLFFIQGIGPAGLHGVFQQAVQVEVFRDRPHQASELSGVQGRGGAAADI